METAMQAPCATHVIRRRRSADRFRRGPNATARAVLDELSRRSGSTGVRYLDTGVEACAGSGITVADTGFADFGSPDRSPVVIRADRPQNTSGPVLVALDDDENPAALTAYGLAEARRRGVALRTVYIWTDCRPPECDHHLACHRDLGEAARLLATIVDEHLRDDEVNDVERDVLHYADPVQALAALSASASLLIVGASSRRPESGVLLGDTTRELVARTRCPLAVVPHRLA